MNDANLRQGPDGCAVLFEKKPVQNARLSEQHGRPIFDTVFLAHVYAPGSKDSSPALELERQFSETAMMEPRRSAHYPRFREAFENWRSGNTDELRGTPLSAWPALDTGRVAELNGVKCFTVEQLAAYPDSSLSQLGMGGMELRERAKAFLAEAAGSSLSGNYAAENERLRTELSRVQGELAASQSQVGQLTAQVAQLSAQPGAPVPATGPAAVAPQAAPLTLPEAGSGTVQPATGFAPVAQQGGIPGNGLI